MSKGAGGAAASSGDRARPPEAAIMDASRWRRDGEIGDMQSAPCFEGEPQGYVDWPERGAGLRMGRPTRNVGT